MLKVLDIQRFSMESIPNSCNVSIDEMGEKETCESVRGQIFLPQIFNCPMPSGFAGRQET